MARHRRLWGHSAIAVDLGKPEGQGRHLATHVHDYATVATFGAGVRASIGQCSCGDTKTLFHVGADR